MSMVSIEPELLLAYQGIEGPKVLKYGLQDADWVLLCDPKMEIELRRETLQVQIDSLKDFKDVSHLEHPVLKFLGFTGFIGYEALAFLNGIESRFESAIPDGLLFFFQTIMVQRGNRVEVASLIPGRVAEISRLLTPVSEFFPTIKNVCVSPSRGEYQLAFERAKEAIHSGNTYQIKLSIKVTADGCIPVLDTFLKLLEMNPSPEAMLFEAHGLSLVSSSPETQLLIRGREVMTRPIGGTWRKENGSEPQHFLQDSKELCEHNMLVDLERNDLGRICEDGSVQVKNFCEIEEYSHLYHMVTTIVGKIKKDLSLSEIIKAILPGGTITGCPKIATMQYISALEMQDRGAYTGVFLHQFLNGDLHSSILIRTIVAYQNRLEIQAGGGIVANSTAEYEYQENLAKARALLEVCSIQLPNESVSPDPAKSHWSQPSIKPAIRTEANPAHWNRNQILMINHYDSFSDNVRHWLLKEADTVVMDANHLDPNQILDNPPRLLVYSPGPGHPDDWPESMSLLKSVLHNNAVPFLGICLGFQMLCVCLNHKVLPLGIPKHGVCEELTALNGRMFSGIHNIRVGRYHSLGVMDEIHSPYLVTARSEDGCIMGMEHSNLPVFGLQFHPESFLCDKSVILLKNLIAYV